MCYKCIKHRNVDLWSKVTLLQRSTFLVSQYYYTKTLEVLSLLRPIVSEIHLIKLTCQATWSVVNTAIVVFITVIFCSIVFSCSVLCKFCVFLFFFYSRAAASVVFLPCCPVQVLSFALCCTSCIFI